MRRNPWAAAATFEPLDAVRMRGGVARSTTLQREGFSPYVIARAVERGQLVRVRRVWVALPGADRELVSAARDGVVLSCITQARRLGLWVVREPASHVAAAPHARGGPRSEKDDCPAPPLAGSPTLADRAGQLLLVEACSSVVASRTGLIGATSSTATAWGTAVTLSGATSSTITSSVIISSSSSRVSASTTTGS